MKKLTALILLFALLTSLLAGCGEDKNSDSQPDDPQADDPQTDNTQTSDNTESGDPAQDNTPDSGDKDIGDQTDEPLQVKAPVEIPEEGVTINGEYYSKEALALIAVGDAYVNRGKWIQYDDSRLVAGSAAPSPIYRWSHGNNGVQDPENSSEKHTLYTNCAAFIHTLYKEAFNFDLGSWTTAQFIERDDMIVFKYEVTGEEDGVQRQGICNKVWETLRPGDLIVYRYNGEANGHIMAYVGNDTLVHSTAPGGGSFDYSTPKEKAETNGSIQYMDVKNLFRESQSRYLFKLSRFAVLRPLEAFKDEIEITDETLNRMQYMSGVVAQLYSTHPYGNSANPGDEITYTVRIENKNELAVECALELELDKNAVLVSSGDRTDGGSVYWETTVGAGSTIEISYTVKVDPDTPLGGKLTCGTFKINGVQLKCPDIAVRTTLSAAEQQAVAAAARASVGKKSEPMELANSIYTAAMGKSAGLDSEKAVFDGVFGFFGGTSTHLYIDKSEEHFDLVVDAIYGGRYVVNSTALSKRTSVVTPLMLMSGDILIAANDVNAKTCSTYMMLDNGTLMELDYSNGARILSSADTEDLLMKVLAKHAFVVLRPSYGM